MSKNIAAGGGSSAASWAVHSACPRYRGTDPMVTGISRRKLADRLGSPDVDAGIPDARWTRAMIFERLCHDPAFASEVATRVAGWSGLERPQGVVMADCAVSVDTTRRQLEAAANRANAGEATLLFKLAFPYPGFPEGETTNVLPDLAVVARARTSPVLIVGDAKDYERVRSRIDDGRMLKGFLQVAMGAFAFSRWQTRPTELSVSEFGFLAVPRSVFLQPTIQVEKLTDYLTEVEWQWQSRLDAFASAEEFEGEATELAAHLEAAFDPGSCPSCSLFRYCRKQVRDSVRPEGLLLEIGVPRAEWPAVLPLLHGDGAPSASPTTASRVRATLTGRAGSTGQRRLDPAGRPGTVNVVAVKSDAAALGYHGIAVSRQTPAGRTPWAYRYFDDPQADLTRRTVMNVIGQQIELAMSEMRALDSDNPDPVHIVVPDTATADLLASTADLLAGVELSRLRWARDLEMGREILTYDGEPATMPKPLEGARRVAVSFLLEHDRARMLHVREPLIDLTSVMTRHIIPGGSSQASRRLDYLVEWAGSPEPVDHRDVTDRIEACPHTPGARLGNEGSNGIHAALFAGRKDESELAKYGALVQSELQYRTSVCDQALEILSHVPDSRLQPAYRTLEGDAQAVWRRRMKLRASDLVRFGRTYAYWRNRLVDVIQQDLSCHDQVVALTNPQRAAEAATDSGNGEVSWATVVSTQPLLLRVDSRRFAVDDDVVLLDSDESRAWLEREVVDVKPQGGSIRLQHFPLGPLQADPTSEDSDCFAWDSKVDPDVSVGDRVILAKLDMFHKLSFKDSFNVLRPKQDDQAAPKKTCEDNSYARDPGGHKWCCRPHEAVEAEFSDEIARRRLRNELNPEVWPPVRDADGFEVPPNSKPTSRDVTVAPAAAPEELTTDELD